MSKIVIKMRIHAKHVARKRKLVLRAVALLILNHLLQTTMEFNWIQTVSHFATVPMGIGCTSRIAEPCPAKYHYRSHWAAKPARFEPGFLQ
jgi:hypothetical protein